MELHEIRYFLAVGENAQLHEGRGRLPRHPTRLDAGDPQARGRTRRDAGVRERGNIHLTDLGRLLEPSLRAMMVQAGEAKRTAESFLRA